MAEPKQKFVIGLKPKDKMQVKPEEFTLGDLIEMYVGAGGTIIRGNEKYDVDVTFDHNAKGELQYDRHGKYLTAHVKLINPQGEIVSEVKKKILPNDKYVAYLPDEVDRAQAEIRKWLPKFDGYFGQEAVVFQFPPTYEESMKNMLKDDDSREVLDKIKQENMKTPDVSPIKMPPPDNSDVVDSIEKLPKEIFGSLGKLIDYKFVGLDEQLKRGETLAKLKLDQATLSQPVQITGQLYNVLANNRLVPTEDKFKISMDIDELLSDKYLKKEKYNFLEPKITPEQYSQRLGAFNQKIASKVKDISKKILESTRKKGKVKVMTLAEKQRILDSI